MTLSLTTTNARTVHLATIDARGRARPNQTHMQAEHLGPPLLCAVLYGMHTGPVLVACAWML